MTLETYPTRTMELGALTIARALPNKGRRLVGPWCFLDRFGPLTFTDGKPMDVAPHPHIGLQTVSWLLDGEVLHDDSLGYQALLRRGGVNIMTSGWGISHSEQSPQPNTGRLNGVQLWVALPDAHRRAKPALQHLEQVPSVELPGGVIQVFSGSFAGTPSRALHYSELVGADIQVLPGQSLTLGLRDDFEHAVLLMDGQCAVAGAGTTESAVEAILAIDTLCYLGHGRSEIRLKSSTGARVLLLGGVPFPEPIVMWWNFVARTREEIAEARTHWEERRDRFGEVRAYNGPRLDAPALARVVPPNPVS